MPQPPLLPAETFARVLRLARVDGLGVLVVAALAAVVAASAGDFVGAVTGLLVAGAGALELHGAGLLRAGEPRGTGWLVGSQLFLLVTILTYCAVRFTHIDLPPIPEEMRPMLELNAAQAKMTVDEFLVFGYRLVLWLVAIASIFYQGGMALYYLRRRHAIDRALAEEIE